MSNKEWNLNSGFPEAMKSFGGWSSRETENSFVNKPIYRKEEDFNTHIQIDVGQIFLNELKKYHNIEDGFVIDKKQDMIVSVDGSNFNCQLFIVKTPWRELPMFPFYSPKDQEGFIKFASKIRGSITLGKQGTIENPEPYWSWNTLTIDGLEQVDKNGPPILVEYNNKEYFGYLEMFFSKNKNPLIV
jgi:hypothetical protein